MSLEEFENTPGSKNEEIYFDEKHYRFWHGIHLYRSGHIIFFAKQFHLYNNFTDSVPAKIFAGLVIIYGAWRIYGD